MSVKRVCIFCKDPTQKLSGEHVFPDWLNKYIKTETYLRHVRMLNGKPQTTYSSEINRTVNRVCKNCNEGWMSKLEADTEKIISEIAFNNMSRIDKLDERKQSTLAFWAQKTALIVQQTLPKSHKISASHYTNLFALKKPLPAIYTGISFRLRSGDNKDNPVVGFTQYGCMSVDSKKKVSGLVKDANPMAWSACIVVGAVVFLVLGNNSDNEGAVGVKDERILRTINPYTGNIDWFPEWPVEAIGGHDYLIEQVQMKIKKR